MPALDQLLPLLPLILLVAVLYSSVGHGGASGYLAVISLLGFATKSFVPLVLALNILVASVSFIHYRLPGAFSLRKLLPFVITSIPAAYFGGMWKVSDSSFELVLGIILLLAAVRLILTKQIGNPNGPHRRFAAVSIWAIGLPVGLVLGFVSGMIGIGGGIFLSPILLFLGLTDIKGSAALSSAFIVTNSIAGLAGHASTLSVLYNSNAAVSLALTAIGLIGAFAGSRWGAASNRPRKLELVLAGVLAFASVKLVASAFS